jgi:hypothetical protein
MLKQVQFRPLIEEVEKVKVNLNWNDIELINFILNHLNEFENLKNTDLEEVGEEKLEKLKRTLLNEDLVEKAENGNLAHGAPQYTPISEIDRIRLSEKAYNIIDRYGSYSNFKNNSIPNNFQLVLKSPFDELIEKFKTEIVNTAPIKIKTIFNNTIQKLSDLEDFKNSEIKSGFAILLFNSLNFLQSRMDGTVRNFPEIKYLTDGYPNPMEKDLQKDYYTYMKSVHINCNIDIEKSDVAGGRVDVLFQFGNFVISSEIKRDFEDCSFESIKDKYLCQSAEYSNTSAKLGFLFVLDLTSKHQGFKVMESCVKVEIVEKTGDPVKRGIVVILIQGNRKTPSKVR